VSLNWRLMQMPAAVFDYVLVHELCHLLVPNHSSRFWREVARALPDFEARRAMLHRLGRQLVF
jgi:predicted metal-dependent hydrolase